MGGMDHTAGDAMGDAANGTVDGRIENGGNTTDAINADRFSGFAGLYENVRPSVPRTACDILVDYLGHRPGTVVDLGCGTGLSTMVWNSMAERVIGIEPNGDMLAETRTKVKASGNEDDGDESIPSRVSFVKAFADRTTLPDLTADIVVCSQSFHWMEPQATLAEVNRILKPGGIFATIDCDWPPVSEWRADQAYQAFMELSQRIQDEHAGMRSAFRRWNKNGHLTNIRECGHFKYSREIVFLNHERCDADRFIGLAFSQSAVQAILKTNPSLIEHEADTFRREINTIFGDRGFDIGFCYRMRVGVK